RVFSDAINSKLFRQSVEEHITRLIDGLADIGGPVNAMFCNYPALEVAPVECCATAAVHMHVFGDAFLHSGGSHDDLEGRARRELSLDRLIQQRMVIVIDQLVPLCP